MLTLRRLMCLLLVAAFAAPLWADDAQQPTERDIPPALTEYMGRRIATTMHYEGAPWLTRDSREREEGTAKLMDALNLEPGMVVCDMGSGNGYYTLKIAREIGEQGRVHAVDIQQPMLDMLEERADEADLDERIETILGTVVDPNLEDESIDLMLMVDVYHEFSHPVHMLDAIRRAMRPDGVLVLVEFRAEDPEVPILPLHKMSKDQIMRELPPNGFRLVDEYDELPWQHMMFFERDDILGYGKMELVADVARLEKLNGEAPDTCGQGATDERGNVYRGAGERVEVRSAGGEPLLQVHVGQAVENIRFVGDNCDTLLIETDAGAYALAMKVSGG